MPTRRVIKSVLAGFLGTYTSRYSDYFGYWLIGQIEPDLRHRVIDLLAPSPSGGDSLAFAQRLATQRFHEQLDKSGLGCDIVREAVLEVMMQPETRKGWQGDYISDGHLVVFVARVVLDNGRIYSTTRDVFVAPHDPLKERRRSSEMWGT